MNYATAVSHLRVYRFLLGNDVSRWKRFFAQFPVDAISPITIALEFGILSGGDTYQEAAAIRLHNHAMILEEWGAPDFSPSRIAQALVYLLGNDVNQWAYSYATCFKQEPRKNALLRLGIGIEQHWSTNVEKLRAKCLALTGYDFIPPVYQEDGESFL